ncbi:MAG: glycerophosphodiester phosphodiesterase family protein [Acidimicrobiia bacterium]
MGPAGGDTTAPAGPRLQRLLVAAAAIVLVASACGSDDDDGTAATSPAAVAATTLPAGEAAPLDVQGHRGARGLRPENTLPAFETALDLGVTTLELDLHLSADGRIVVWHDPEIDADKCRLADGAADDVPDPDDVLVPSRDRRIRALTVAQLEGYRCDRNPDEGRFPDQTAEPTTLAADFGIVTLGELFDFVAGYAVSDTKTAQQRREAAGVIFNIETKRKVGEPGTIGDGFDGVNAGPFEMEILRVVAEHDLRSRVVIQSFDHRSLWAVHALDPGIALAALSVREGVDFGALAANGATIWSPNQDAVTAQRLADAHAAGLSVIPWTVNGQADMERLVDLGIDGLITDRPDLLLEMVRDA